MRQDSVREAGSARRIRVTGMIVGVAGGRGFVGAGVVKAPLSRGDEVSVLTRRACVPALPGARLFTGNLADRIPKACVAGAEALYHCAGELRNEARMHAVQVARRLSPRDQPRDGAAVDLQPPRDLRCEIPSAPNARTCAHSNALRTSRPVARRRTDPSSLGGEADAIQRRGEWCFRLPILAQYWAAGIITSPD